MSDSSSTPSTSHCSGAARGCGEIETEAEVPLSYPREPEDLTHCGSQDPDAGPKRSRSEAIRIPILPARTPIAALFLALAFPACGGGTDDSASTAASGSSTVTIAVAASPTSVASGGASMLSWSSTNAASCTASGAWSGDKATSGGTESTGALTESRSYTLTCTGSGGSESGSVEVTVSRTPPVHPVATYSTNFSSTENPISEGGKWVNGKTVGLDWNDVQAGAGKAYAAELISAVRYDDSIAHLNSPVFAANQYAQGEVSRVPGYRNPTDKHEIELLLRFRIDANSAGGYEVLWGQAGGIFVVRWNGPLSDYTSLGGVPAPGPGPAVDGDILRVEIIGNIISVYKNGNLVVTAHDPNSTWTDGQPGIGFWPTPGSTLESYGWTNFEAGNL